MRNPAKAILAAAVLLCLAPAANADLAPYSQDFELLDQLSLTALGDDGWVVYGNVYAAADTSYLYGYGVFPAPNDITAPAFCMIDIEQGGIEQGYQQLVVISDYNNVDHGNGNFIESNTFREMTIGAADVGKTYKFAYQAKLGNIAGGSTALAFIKTLDPTAGYATTNFVSLDMTSIPTEWGGYDLSLTITPELEGQLFQIGFSSMATLYESSGIYYDNIVFGEDDVSPVPDSSVALGPVLRQNYPNPFNPSTRIDFSVETAGKADLSVYDLAGRRVATLHSGNLPNGDHHVVWNGRMANGAAAPAGQYRYVLKTADGSVARSMVLLK